MKTTFFTLIACLFATILFATPDSNPAMEAKTIKTIIQQAYIDGLNNGNNLQAIKRYVHKDFECKGMFNNKMTRVTKKDCLNRLKQIQKYPKSFDCRNYSGDIKMIDITGNTAIVKLLLKNKEKKCYIEYLSLIKQDNEWIIINKIYSLPCKSYHEEG